MKTTILKDVKKIIKNILFAALAALLVFSCIGFVACRQKPSDEVTEYKVTYVDITEDNKVLKTEDVAEGNKATVWTPEKEGYTFVQWYATPDMLHVFDFDKAIMQDTTVYGYFTSAAFEAVIKGPANDGTWNNSQRYASKNGKTEMILKLSKGEFGFTLYGDAMDPQYGDYVGFDKIGANGNANSLFTQPENGGNNIVCTVEGTYKIVIDYSTGAPVVDFYVPDWEVIVKGSAFDVGWNGTDRLPSFGSRFELEYDFIEGGEFGFAVFGDGADQTYGDYVGWRYIGKNGDANQFFSQKGNGNNIVCNKGGRYKIVIDFSGDDYVLDFYLVA